jgi:hypothetical protein
MSNENNMETAKANLAAKRAAKQMAITAEPPPAALVPVASGMTSLQIVQNTPALEKLGETFAASGFFGAVTKSTATAALVNCFIEGLSPVEYKAKYHTMNDGTTSIKSDYIQREFHRLGGAWKFNEWTPEVCDITFTYRGSELRGRVTFDEFKQNGVAIGKNGIKDNWRKFPREMLKARCMATYIRALCPEALGGMYTQEETMDFNGASAPRVITPAAEQPAAKPEVVTPEVMPPAPPADPNVCPCGKSKGKRFEDLPTDTLEKILDNAAKYPAITDAHKAAIVAVLHEREAEG